MSVKIQKLIDDETLVFLTKQREDDTQISTNIQIDQYISQFRSDHAERLNNFKTDELFLEQAHRAEQAYLEKSYEKEQANTLLRHAEDAKQHQEIFEDQRIFTQLSSEMKSLTTQLIQSKTASERLKRGKLILKERRAAAQEHLRQIDKRHEQERKNLAESQALSLKQMKLNRHVVLKDIEDAQMRIALGGKEVNRQTLKEDKIKSHRSQVEDDRRFNAYITSQMAINAKELENLREEQLIEYASASKYCEQELQIIDEAEAILADHTLKEQQLEASHKKIIHEEEDRISTMVFKLQAAAIERHTIMAAQAVRDSQRRESQKRSQEKKKEAQVRQDQFWEHEDALLMAHLKARDLDHMFYDVQKEVLKGHANQNDSALKRGDGEDLEVDGEESGPMIQQVNIEAERAKELAFLDGLKREQAAALRKMKSNHYNGREKLREEQQKSLRAIIATRDDELNSLRVANQKIMDVLAQEQRNASTNNSAEKANESLLALLPEVISSAIQRGQKIEPKVYPNLTFLSASIANIQQIISTKSASDALKLINRVYAAFDDVLEAYEDIVKIDVGSTSYTLVSGISTHTTKSAQAIATQTLTLAHSLLKAIRTVETRDILTNGDDILSLKVGVHSGSAMGGIVHPHVPKFHLMGGDLVEVARVLEETGRGQCVHVSEATQELVKGAFETDVSETVHVNVGGRKMRVRSFWVLNEINNRKKNVRRGVRSLAAQ